MTGRIIPIVLMTILLNSCAPPKAFEYRDYKNFSVQKLGVSATTIKMDLIYFNPNNFGLQLKRTDLDIYIDNTYLGHTSQEMQISIPRRQEFALPIQMDVDMKNIWKNALNSFFSQEVTIKITGTVKVGKANIFASFPVNYEGKQTFSVF